MPRRPLPVLPILVLLAACGDDPPPTGPVSPDVASAEAVTADAAGSRVVNSLADPGDGSCDARQCTLREAIKASGTTSITFAPGLTGTITLADPAGRGGPLAINTSLTITGPTAGIVIRRRSADAPFRIVRVGEGATVVLSHLTLSNGRTDQRGAGVLNLGRLTLVGCTVSGNTSTSAGGGIENRAVLTLTRATVSRNTARSGGGIDNDDARLVAAGSVISGNTGGGIVNRGGTLKLTDVGIHGNAGSGLSEDRGGSALNRVRITGNTSGGYALSLGTTTITHSTIAGNSGVNGAGIGVFMGGHLTVSKSTISGNAATADGGGIYVRDDPFGRLGGDITLVNSTVAGNSAASGGGVMVHSVGSASARIVNSSIASNVARVRGGGVAGFNFDGGAVDLTNSIVARNTAPAAPDVVGDLGARFSLIGDGSGSDLTNADGNLVGRVAPHAGPIDPLLGPLADNGGPTRTRALLAGSPALDAAAAADCPAKDQRDVARPQGEACDMGSYERE